MTKLARWDLRPLSSSIQTDGESEMRLGGGPLTAAHIIGFVLSDQSSMAAFLVRPALASGLFTRLSSKIRSSAVFAPGGVPSGRKVSSPAQLQSFELFRLYVASFPFLPFDLANWSFFLFFFPVSQNLHRFRSSSSSPMASSEPKESPSNNPGLHLEPDEATRGYFLQQTVRSLRLRKRISVPANVEANPGYLSDQFFFYKINQTINTDGSLRCFSSFPIEMRITRGFLLYELWSAKFRSDCICNGCPRECDNIYPTRVRDCIWILPLHHIEVHLRISSMRLNVVHFQMFRIKDPKASLDFYSRVLGMRWITDLVSSFLRALSF